MTKPIMKKFTYLLLSLLYAIIEIVLIAILFVPSILITLFLQIFKKKDAIFRVSNYIRDIVFSIDQTCNVMFATVLNLTLIKAYRISSGELVETFVNLNRFGDPDETISSVLGKNKLTGNLTQTGKVIVRILNVFEKNHAEKSIGM